MQLKEISITEIMGLLSFVGIAISVIAQTYFYLRLDAIWVMSIISPTIYLLDIIKVIVCLLVIMGSIITLESFYRKVTKKIRLREKIVYIENQKTHNLLVNNRKKYERNFQFLIFLIIWGICFLLSDFKIKSTYIFFVIIGMFFGVVLFLALDKSLSKTIRKIILGLLLVIGAIGLGEFKYTKIPELPFVLLDNKKSEFNKTKLLEISKTEAILLKKDKNGAFSFKIVQVNQIDKIINDVVN